MSLTDMQARKAAPREKDCKLTDSGGHYLYVTRKGFKSWRMKSRFAANEKQLVFGPYPEVSLANAREKRDERSEGRATTLRTVAIAQRRHRVVANISKSTDRTKASS